MIDHWLSDDGRKARMIMGRIEWEEGVHKHSVDYHHSGYFAIYCDADNACGRSIDTVEALALLRDHAREWLCRQGFCFHCTIDTDDGAASLEVMQDGTDGINVTAENYDLALVETIIAMPDIDDALREDLMDEAREEVQTMREYRGDD